MQGGDNMTRIENAEIFGKNLNLFIEKSGKDQKDIAMDLDFPPTTLNTWCMGKVIPPLIKIRRLADYFGCKVTDLIEPLSENRLLDIEFHNTIKGFDEHQMSRMLEYAKMLKQYKE